MSLNYCLMVTGASYGSHRSASALQFCQTLVLCSHNVGMVFFYQDGVYNLNASSLSNVDEVNLVRMWQDFSNQNKVILYVCIRAALRRGVLNNKQESQCDNTLINDVFRVCGLSSIIENLLFCDRFIQF